jgi:hypothetical protein
VAGHNRTQRAGDRIGDLAAQAAAGMRGCGGHVRAFLRQFQAEGTRDLRGDQGKGFGADARRASEGPWRGDPMVERVWFMVGYREAF